MTILAAIRTRVNSSLMPPVLPENAVTSRHANLNCQARCVGSLSTSVICPNTALGPRNSAQKIFLRSMAYLVKLGKPSATRAHAEHILTNAGFFGAHRARSQIINVTNKTEKAADTATVGITASTSPTSPV